MNGQIPRVIDRSLRMRMAAGIELEERGEFNGLLRKKNGPAFSRGGRPRMALAVAPASATPDRDLRHSRNGEDRVPTDRGSVLCRCRTQGTAPGEEAPA